MKKIVLGVLAACATLAAVNPAEAAQGCGPGWHRDYYGHCRPNGYGRPYGPALVVGGYYRDRGWWDGRRYWNHRERWHGGWRYR